ncbi:hypothetical protein [Parabacteroides chinchillae]
MKQYKYILQFVVALFFFAACSDESIVNPEDKVEEGLPATVMLAFKSADAPELETRATDVGTAMVEGLAILVFDKTTKDKIGKTQFFSGEKGSSGNVLLSTTSGERLIYAVANYNSSNYGELEQTLKDVINLDGLKNLQIRLQNKQFTFLDGKILMSGFYGTDGSCTIKAGNNTFTEGIGLKRIASTVLVNWTCTKGEFIPESWEVKKLPNESALIERENDDYISSYFKTGEQTAFSKELTSADNSFSFIMFENRKVAEADISSVDMREYAENEVENFKKAPANSTYLVLKGTYKGKTYKDQNGNNTGEEREVNATVQYYVHLGLVNGNNDFSIDRNSKYSYNLKINGVDDIIVEVTKNDHVYRADGQITLPDNPTVVLDAHYGVVKLKFSKELINGIKADVQNLDGFKANFQIKASTPVNSYNYNTDDLDWITFTRNTSINTDGNPSRNFAPYHPDKAKPVSAFQEELYNLKETDFLDGYVYYTCYIDEYYYPGKSLSTFINAKDRSVQINYKQIPVSGASDSEIISSIYLIRQHSIQTIYDLDELTRQNVNGWGVEWSMEHGAMEYSLNDNKGGKSSDTDGRKNMIDEVLDITLGDIENQGPSWDTYVDFYNNSNQKTYAYAYAECMNRNRDLNGDGKIQNDEIRWYLPAINQYVGMWIGAPALNPEVCLYTLSSSAETYHYVSNTQQGALRPRIIWAEEGSSLGNLRHNEENGVEGKWMYRCVRNIGNKGVTGYQDYVKFIGSATEGGTFDISLLNKAALRQAISEKQSLGTHTHVDEENEIAKNGFAVSGRQTSECNPRLSWRLPNQRETTLISAYIPDIVNNWDRTNNQFASCTKYKWNTAQIYWFQIEGNGLYGNVTKGTPIKSSYRCVCDK